ncbi:MAG: hypothetical protein E7564_06420 [Ruminococcaceae bacterium]|nr:hypothetical protein [Oscillospiraceae bacterium]
MAKSKYKLKLKKSYMPLVFNLHDILGIAAIIWALSFIFSFGTDFDLDKGIKLGFESEDLEDISSLFGSIDTVDYFGDIGGIL